MARQYRRDLIGHFITNRQRTQQPCTHACCRGYRVHPKNYPTILPDRTLRQASDHDLAEHFDKVSAGDTPEDERARAQILHEFERRDAQAEQQRRHREAVQAGQAARKMEREAETERLYLQAEEYTRGNWTNAKGSVALVSDREILTGREAVFQRYASEEAKEFFRSNPRPTAAYFRGRDTRYQGAYTERPKRPARGPAGRSTRRRDAFNAKVWRA